MAKQTGATKTKYKYVYQYKKGAVSRIGKYFTKIKNSSGGKVFENLEEAGKWVDLQLIRDNREPVNGFYKRKV